TQILLVNPSDNALTGSVQFFNSLGQNATVSVNGQVKNNFSYSIPARSSQKLQTAGTGTSITAGWVGVVPSAGTVAPLGSAIFSFRNAGVTVSEAGVPAAPPAA